MQQSLLRAGLVLCLVVGAGTRLQAADPKEGAAPPVPEAVPTVPPAPTTLPQVDSKPTTTLSKLPLVTAELVHQRDLRETIAAQSDVTLTAAGAARQAARNALELAQAVQDQPTLPATNAMLVQLGDSIRITSDAVRQLVEAVQRTQAAVNIAGRAEVTLNLTVQTEAQTKTAFNLQAQPQVRVDQVHAVGQALANQAAAVATAMNAAAVAVQTATVEMDPAKKDAAITQVLTKVHAWRDATKVAYELALESRSDALRQWSVATDQVAAKTTLSLADIQELKRNLERERVTINAQAAAIMVAAQAASKETDHLMAQAEALKARGQALQDQLHEELRRAGRE